MSRESERRPVGETRRRHTTASSEGEDSVPPKLTRARWRDAIRLSDLSATTRSVALALHAYWPKEQDNAQDVVLWRSVGNLATDTGLSTRSVKRHMQLLVDEGWLILVAEAHPPRQARRFRPSIGDSLTPMIGDRRSPMDEADWCPSDTNIGDSGSPMIGDRGSPDLENITQRDLFRESIAAPHGGGGDDDPDDDVDSTPNGPFPEDDADELLADWCVRYADVMGSPPPAGRIRVFQAFVYGLWEAGWSWSSVAEVADCTLHPVFGAHGVDKLFRDVLPLAGLVAA